MVEGENIQVDATDIKPGRFVIFEGVACIVRNNDISKAGKHGHKKCRIEAIAIKDGRKFIKILPGHDKIEVPIIEKKNAQVLSISGNIANVMDTESYETFNVNIPEELQGKLNEGMQVMYWVVLGERIIKQIKGTEG
ncbi:translation initiation factor IF-5A [archaeon]|nr:translation initiation factor IF-5A [archaeon]